MPGDRPKLTPARSLALLLALGAACAGATKKDVEHTSALAELPGRWDNGFVELQTPGGPVQMHYVAAGPKDAPRVILLHGFPDFAYTWREVAPLLSKDF